MSRSDWYITNGSSLAPEGDGYIGEMIEIQESGDSLSANTVWGCKHRHGSEEEAWACSSAHVDATRDRIRKRRGSKQVEQTPREPIVKFYKDREPNGNGAFATSTTATDPEEFLREAATSLPHILQVCWGDHEFTLDALLPQICEIWAKLKGYKAEHVFEERRLVVGAPFPERAMDYLNAEMPESFNGRTVKSDATTEGQMARDGVTV